MASTPSDAAGFGDGDYWELVTFLVRGLALAARHGRLREAAPALEEYAALFHDDLKDRRAAAVAHLLNVAREP